ncbi:MAG: hypothetical protein JSV20_05790 [Candidatus Bathyarchaeota archaeon]|nr:MAG: hypothetical protein JSV20_05790 [Candidatus Bathyarchaeota archaeon]
MKRTLLITTLMVIIVFSFTAYTLATFEGVRHENDREGSSGATNFKAVVNGMRSVNVLVHVDLSDGLTKEEAKQITDATFTQVMGQNVMRQLESLTINAAQITAHYVWGYDENDMGHVFYMDVDLTSLQITVSHCF